MSKLLVNVPRFTSLLVFGAMSAATFAADLSRYRDFQLGTDLPTVAKQTGANPSQAKVIHRRPALIQDLAWRPQSFSLSSKAEPAEEVVFSFYEGELFRIVVNYDRYETEGLTSDDIVDAISVNYGTAVKLPAPAKGGKEHYGQEEVLARWQDPQYRFDLVRLPYGPSFRLIGVLRKLEQSAETAGLEATRLDEREAPQREAARVASQEDEVKAKLEKARLLNKPKFRP
jgi:hypothetical protein